MKLLPRYCISVAVFKSICHYISRFLFQRIIIIRSVNTNDLLLAFTKTYGNVCMYQARLIQQILTSEPVCLADMLCRNSGLLGGFRASFQLSLKRTGGLKLESDSFGVEELLGSDIHQNSPPFDSMMLSLSLSCRLLGASFLNR